MADVLPIPECPHCHQSDKVEKVSDIVADGFSTVPEEGAEPYPWAGQTYYIRYKKRSESDMAVKPIVKPAKGKVFTSKTVYSWDMLPRDRVTSVPLADRLLPKIEKPLPPGDITKSMGCFNIFLWPFLIRRVSNWAYRNLEADYTHKLLKQTEAEDKWAKLYYCYRCEGVFTVDSDFVPVQQMNNMIFDLDPLRWFPKSARPDSPPSQKK